MGKAKSGMLRQNALLQNTPKGTRNPNELNRGTSRVGRRCPAPGV